MNRRAFISALGGAVVCPMTTRAQQRSRIRRVGVLSGNRATDPELESRRAALEGVLQEQGWVIGRDIEIQYRWGGGDTELTRAYAKELVAMQPDVIFAGTNTSMAALHRESSSVPIVFVMVSDPVGMRYVDSFARPGRNVTGFTPFEPSLGSKWLSLLKEIAPKVEQVGLLFNPETGNNSAGFIQPIEAAASSSESNRSYGHEAALPKSSRSFLLLARCRTGLIFLPDAYTFTNRETIVSLIARHKLPAIYPLRTFAAAGGLLSYGVDVQQLFRQAALYVDRILRGARPADLPVQAPTKFELVINLKTAKALGLDVPPVLLAGADEVIE